MIFLMSSLRSLLATMTLCLISSCALGSISGLAGANALGSANVSYLWFRLYTVTLYSTQDTWSFAHPFGLELLYHRDISAADIVENTIDQIKTWLSSRKRLATMARSAIADHARCNKRHHPNRRIPRKKRNQVLYEQQVCW